MKKPVKTAVAIAAATTFVVVGAGCGVNKFTEPYKDAPRSGHDNGGAADIVRMPDGFSNVATKCDHGNRIYVAFHNDKAFAAITAIANDPTCSSSK